MAINLPKRSKGFTLLEAIVAMVLISTLGASLFLWLNNSLAGLYRAERAESENAAKLQILEYIKSVNPMRASEGRQDFGTFKLEWSAKPITNIFDGTNYPEGVGTYQLALYEVLCNARNNDGNPWFDMTIKQTGYKKVRSSTPFFGN